MEFAIREEEQKRLRRQQGRAIASIFPSELLAHAILRRQLGRAIAPTGFLLFLNIQRNLCLKSVHKISDSQKPVSRLLMTDTSQLFQSSI
jgi:hypothetical protein